MGRNQQGSLKKTLNKRTGIWSWWGRYRMYDKTGGSCEQSTFLGYAHEVTERQARIKLIDLIQRMNRRARTVHKIGPEDALKKELAHAGPPSRSLSGAISELVVSADLMARGYEVFRALCPQATCDLIAFKDGEFQRVEVKTNDLTSIHRNMGKFDIAAVFSPKTGKIEYKSAFNLKGLAGRQKSGKECGSFEIDGEAKSLESNVDDIE